MAFVKYVGFIFIMVVGSNHVLGLMDSGDVRSHLFTSYSFPANFSSYYRRDGGGLYNFGFRDTPLVNGSMFNSTINKIRDAPLVKLIFRVYELYQTETEPVDVLLTVLSSPEMRELIRVWLTRSDVPLEQINAVQVLISSKEMADWILVLTSENETSSATTVCVTYNFTKLPEFRQLLDYVINLSLSSDDLDLEQLTSFFQTFLGQTSTTERPSVMTNFNSSMTTEFLFSPVIQAFLEVFCELTQREDIPDIDFPIPPTNDTSNPPQAGAQALSSVANFTTSTPDELLDQFQDLIGSPELAQVIGSLNTTLNISELLSQIGIVITSGNLTAIQEILTQFQNLTEGNGTSAIEGLVSQLVQQANDGLQVFLPLAIQYIENLWRSALKENGVSESCQDSSMTFVQALTNGETWAFQFLDSMGKIPSNLLSFPMKWLGSFDECTGIRSSGSKDDSFKGKYCRTTIPIPGQLLEGVGITYGTCVPSSCSAEDTLGILLTVQKLLFNGTTPLVPGIDCVEDLEFKIDAIIVTCILVIFGFVVLCGTLYDVVSVQMKSSETISEDLYTSSRGSLSSTRTSALSTSSSSDSSLPASLYKPIKTRLETSPGFTNNVYTSGDETVPGVFNHAYNSADEEPTKQPDGLTDDKTQSFPNDAKTEDTMVNIPDKNVKAPLTESKDKGTLERFMMSFSAYTNGVKVLSTQQASGSLGAINGIRFLSMAWVILGHTYSFGFGYDDNLFPFYAEKLNDWSFSAIIYATVSVDSFFTISGILVGYLTLRQLKKVGGAKKLNWFMFYFHRFWRLTPPYMLIMMVGTVLLPLMATGPMWGGGDFIGMEGCRNYWWTNLLYINNFVNVFDETKMCMGWTWYLANDMQFYILSPLILLPLFYNVIAGIISCLIFLVGTITATAILVHKYEYVAQDVNFIYGRQAGDEYQFQRIYVPCYTRMGPYIIGLFTGYLLYRFNNKCRIPKALNLLGWLLCLAICCLDVYGLYSYKDNHILTQLQSDFFLSLHRTGWGVAISWIVFACATGHGGWINEVLSWKPFIPLGRLTYGAYLLHPLVMYLFIASRRNPTFFSDFEVVYLFLGHITLSYGAAFVVGLFFESPMMGLEKVFFNPKKK